MVECGFEGCGVWTCDKSAGPWSYKKTFYFLFVGKMWGDYSLKDVMFDLRGNGPWGKEGGGR